MPSEGLGASLDITAEIIRSSLLAGSGWILLAGLSPPGLAAGVAAGRVAAPVAVVAAGRVVVAGRAGGPVAAAVSAAIPAPVAAHGPVVAGVAAAVAAGAADGPVAWGVAHAVARVPVAARHLGVVEGGKANLKERRRHQG